MMTVLLARGEGHAIVKNSGRRGLFKIILEGERFFQVKLASARGDFKSEVFAGRFFTWV